MHHRLSEADIMAQAQNVLKQRIALYGRREERPTIPRDPVKAERSRRTCHRYSLYERPRAAPPRDSGAYIPEMAARIEDDPNLTDGARRCARKLMEYTYRRNRTGRQAEITVTYLMRALDVCRRSVQRYLRLLQREGYIFVDVVTGGRSRMCVGLIVHLLAPLFPRHHRQKWPQKSVESDATRESQNYRYLDSRGKYHPKIPCHEWALRCMEGVWRSFQKTIPPLLPAF